MKSKLLQGRTFTLLSKAKVINFLKTYTKQIQRNWGQWKNLHKIYFKI